MELEDKIAKMRMNEFSFGKPSYLGSEETDFPRKIDILKWEESEPTKVYDIKKKEYITCTSFCYVIATLEWDDHEPCWEFRSVGTRYLEESTQELTDWILDFCESYYINDDGKLCEYD